MNPLAQELNDIIIDINPYIYRMLSDVGKNLFFPKGILYQTAEAKEKAYRFNATIGMATEKGHPMSLPSIMEWINLEAEKAITYAPAFGIPELRKVWKRNLYKKNPSLAGKEISLPLVTHAITHGLSIVADMWVDAGDAIILPDKMWGNYNLIFSIRRNAKIFNYPLFKNDGKLNLKAFQQTLKTIANKRKKLIIILNFPNNPTGYTPTLQEAMDLKDIILQIAQRGTNIITVTDDAYFGLFYEEGILKESMFSYLTNQDPRLLAIKLDGATKEDFVWGLRVGFITYGGYAQKNLQRLYDALEKKTAGAIRGSISNVNHLGQEMLLNALSSPNYQDEKEEKREILRQRAKKVKKVLSNLRYNVAWDVYSFNSGYFMCLRLKTVNAEKLRSYLLEKYGIGLISLNDKDIRITFSSIEEEDIQTLFDNIFQAIKELEKQNS